jgi:hypothetical protein
MIVDVDPSQYVRGHHSRIVTFTSRHNRVSRLSCGGSCPSSEGGDGQAELIQFSPSLLSLGARVREKHQTALTGLLRVNDLVVHTAERAQAQASHYVSSDRDYYQRRSKRKRKRHTSLLSTSWWSLSEALYGGASASASITIHSVSHAGHPACGFVCAS